MWQLLKHDDIIDAYTTDTSTTLRPVMHLTLHDMPVTCLTVDYSDQDAPRVVSVCRGGQVVRKSIPVKVS